MLIARIESSSHHTNKIAVSGIIKGLVRIFVGEFATK